MAQICKICSHPDRLKIDQAIVSGTSLKEISRRFNVTYDSLYRHAQDHLTRQLTKAWQIKSLHEDNKLIEKIDSIISRAEVIFQRNFDAGKDSVALKAISEVRTTIELLSKISYQAHQAKMAEQELLMQQEKQQSSDDSWSYIEALHVLNDAELNLFIQLLRKIKTGNNNLVIRKTPSDFRFNEFSDLVDANDCLISESPPERTGIGEKRGFKIVRTK